MERTRYLCIKRELYNISEIILQEKRLQRKYENEEQTQEWIIVHFKVEVWLERQSMLSKPWSIVF